jgi:short-subunit dehydrogenase
VELRDRSVLITGASTGIGAATARAVARRGGRALLVARSADKLEAVAAEIGSAGGSAAPFAADVGDQRAVAEMAQRVRDEVGTPDVIVNNAGAGRWLFIEETDPEELLEMTAVPYHAAFFVTRAFIDGMLTRGSGHIVNITTPVAYFAWPGALGYAGARWAVRGFSEALRADLRATGIGVSTVVPGKVSSEYFSHNPGTEERIPKIARIMRTLTPEQTADAIVDAIERERTEVMIPLELKLLMLQTRLFPGLTRWVVDKTGAKRTRA